MNTRKAINRFMEFNHVERALDMVGRMVEARAGLQIILGAKYPAQVKGWVDYLREKMEKENKSPIEAMCDLAEDTRDSLTLIILLSAALEIVEEDARREGIAVKENS